LWIALLLAVITFSIYAQVRQFEFVNYEDPDYVTENPHVRGGLSGSGVAWAFTSSYGANWIPLTWISHMADVDLFGTDSGRHHFGNVLLHVGSTLLLFAFLRRATAHDGGARWSRSSSLSILSMCNRSHGLRNAKMC
jgi:hypothetical protein